MSVNPRTGEPICDENHPDADVRLREDRGGVSASRSPDYDEWRETRERLAEERRDEGSERDMEARDELLQPRAWEL